MRAARLHQFGTSPVIDDIDIPTRESGQTLVRIDAAARSAISTSPSRAETSESSRTCHISVEQTERRR
ncbi:hypothetical protein ACETU7_25225 [Rhodococcus sp. 3Y1]